MSPEVGRAWSTRHAAFGVLIVAILECSISYTPGAFNRLEDLIYLLSGSRLELPDFERFARTGPHITRGIFHLRVAPHKLK
jgi:hypothetical protein